jgi:hypothetical protein
MWTCVSLQYNSSGQDIFLFVLLHFLITLKVVREQIHFIKKFEKKIVWNE